MFAGGGVVAEMSVLPSSGPYSMGGEVVAHFFTFPGDLEITRHFWRLTEIQGDLTGLLTHSKNVTTSINWTKKHLPKVWGGHGPLAPWLRHWAGGREGGRKR